MNNCGISEYTYNEYYLNLISTNTGSEQDDTYLKTNMLHLLNTGERPMRGGVVYSCFLALTFFCTNFFLLCFSSRNPKVTLLEKVKIKKSLFKFTKMDISLILVYTNVMLFLDLFEYNFSSSL